MSDHPARLVAYQGETGAYSEAAARRLFPDATAVGYPAFDDVFEAVAAGVVAWAVVPVENTIFGSVHPVYDLLQTHRLRIIGERWQRVRHCLLALPGVAPSDVREVRSHPQALGQSMAYLRAHLPHAAVVQAHDTAGAARQLRDEGRRDVAVVASRRAAEEYGLVVLAEGIETHAGNFTRFLVLVRPEDAPAGGERPCKTSLVFSTFPALPNALYRSLAAFGERGIELLRIECRPLDGQPFRHAYFLDVMGGATDAAVQEALDALAQWADNVRVLGTYPVADWTDRHAILP